MFFSSEQTKMRGNCFKSFLTDRQHEHEITQELIAHAINVRQNTISQFLNPSADHHMPAFLLPLLPDPLAREMLQYLADQCQCTVSKAPAHKDLDGSIDDELLDIDVIQGEIIKLRKSNPKRCLTKINELFAVVETMRAEMIAQGAGQ